MPTASYLIADMQVKLGDPSGNIYTSANLLNWLNEAQKEFCERQLALRVLNATDVQKGQTAFEVASGRIIIELVATRVQIPKVMRHVTPTEYFNQVAACPGARSLDPEVWTEMDGKVYVYPAYGRDSASTYLPFDIGPLQTTIRVKSTASFAASGSFRIDQEKITYTSKNATSFLNCTRGASDTVHSSHDGNDPPVDPVASVVQGEHFWMVYRNSPSVLVDMTDVPDIKEIYHEQLELYAMYLAYMQTGESEKAAHMWDRWATTMKEIQWNTTKEDLTMIGLHDMETMGRPTLYGPRG